MCAHIHVFCFVCVVCDQSLFMCLLFWCVHLHMYMLLIVIVVVLQCMLCVFFVMYDYILHVTTWHV